MLRLHDHHVTERLHAKSLQRPCCFSSVFKIDGEEEASSGAQPGELTEVWRSFNV